MTQLRLVALKSPNNQPTSRALMAGLLALYLWFVLLGSLVPLQYVHRPLASAWRVFEALAWSNWGMDSRADWLANVLLFMPLTLLASLLFNQRQSAGVALLLVLAATLLSASLEFAQLFFPARTVSPNDVVAESVGGLLGLLAHALWGARLQHGLAQCWQHERQQPGVAQWRHAYGLCLLLLGLLPLDLTLSPADLWHKWTQGGLVLLPFAHWHGDVLAQAVGKALAWLPLGGLYGLQGDGRWRRFVGHTLLLAGLIEGLQLFVESRVSDVTDVLLAGMGALGGAVLVTMPRCLARVLGLSLLIGGLLTQLPGLPENLRELMAPGWRGALSALGLALTLEVLGNSVFLLFAARRRGWLLAFPLGLLAQGVLVWGLLRVSVPMESLHDIVGVPVLGWPKPWELLGRFVALHTSLMLPMLGAALCVRLILQPVTLPDVLYVAVLSSLLAWPLYAVVIQAAATDNVTELLAQQASFAAASTLAGAWFLTCLAASAASVAYSTLKNQRLLWGVAAVALLGAAGLYPLGTESVIVKDGQVFSAWQFLLSEDRAHYAVGSALQLRGALALLALCVGLAALQWQAWRGFCRATQGPESKKPSEDGF